MCRLERLRRVRRAKVRDNLFELHECHSYPSPWQFALVWLECENVAPGTVTRSYFRGGEIRHVLRCFYIDDRNIHLTTIRRVRWVFSTRSRRFSGTQESCWQHNGRRASLSGVLNQGQVETVAGDTSIARDQAFVRRAVPHLGAVVAAAAATPE